MPDNRNSHVQIALTFLCQVAETYMRIVYRRSVASHDLPEAVFLTYRFHQGTSLLLAVMGNDAGIFIETPGAGRTGRML